MKCTMSVWVFLGMGDWWEKKSNIEIMTLFGVMEADDSSTARQISAEKQSEDCHNPAVSYAFKNAESVKDALWENSHPATVFILKQNAFLEAFL